MSLVCLWSPKGTSQQVTQALNALTDRLTRIEQASYTARFTLKYRVFRWQQSTKQSLAGQTKPKTLVAMRCPQVSEDAFVYIDDPSAPLRSAASDSQPHCRCTISLLHGSAFEALVARTLLVPASTQASNTITGWVSRTALVVDGLCLTLGDFAIRLGVCSQKAGQHTGVILLEIEYLAVGALPSSSSILTEFLDFLLPTASHELRLVNPEEEFKEAGLAVPDLEHPWTQMHHNVAYVAALKSQGLL